MKKVKGQPSNFNISELSKVSDLLEFDGPLLSHFINDKNENFLFMWCDADHLYNRWIIFKVEKYEIDKYLDDELILLDIMKDRNLYCVDIDNDIKYHNIKEIDLTEYLSYCDEDQEKTTILE